MTRWLNGTTTVFMATVFVAMLFAMGLPAIAADEAEATAADEAASPQPPTPCEDHEKFREFDFWIGEWEVRTAAGQLAGHNVIESAHKGCVLVENWQSVSGGTGMSMNWFDHENNEWVQVWTDSSGGQIEIRGGMTDEGMQLTGRIHYTSNGTTAPFRGLWTPLPDGRVRQFFEQSSDDGDSWQTWFEGFYTRTDQRTDQEL